MILSKSINKIILKCFTIWRCMTEMPIHLRSNLNTRFNRTSTHNQSSQWMARLDPYGRVRLPTNSAFHHSSHCNNTTSEDCPNSKHSTITMVYSRLSSLWRLVWCRCSRSHLNINNYHISLTTRCKCSSSYTSRASWWTGWCRSSLYNPIASMSHIIPWCIQMLWACNSLTNRSNLNSIHNWFNKWCHPSISRRSPCPLPKEWTSSWFPQPKINFNRSSRVRRL